MTLRTLCCFLFLAPFVFAQPESLPDRFAILPESQGPALVRQCSRLAPRDVSGFWSPSVAQVLALEQRLPDLFRKSQPKIKLANYFRQYVGIVSHGRKLIYLNAFIKGGLDVNPKKDWKTTAIIVCDGGDGFWGVEFDPAENTFQHLETNGVA
jgi:hypothetical protein